MADNRGLGPNPKNTYLTCEHVPSLSYYNMYYRVVCTVLLTCVFCGVFPCCTHPRAWSLPVSGMKKECMSQTQNNCSGGTIAWVAPDSIADALQLHPGDVVLAVSGLAVRDVIDYRFALADEYVELLVRTDDGDVLFEIEKECDDDLGIEFVHPLFDRERTCWNACPFCFVAQMPAGMRQSLYLKDDDYRLSFLYGNFITLTNLREEDWERIAAQHLSPLYISVHATDRTLRSILLGRSLVPDVRDQIRRLGDSGIQVHTQIVACPGINDGDALEHTIEDLAGLYPTVQSIAVVPVGITRYGMGQTPGPRSVLVQSYTSETAAPVLVSVQRFGNSYRRLIGRRLVYPADEFFLLCGTAVPPASFYDGYPQYFNGVGITRDFFDAWNKANITLPRRVAEQRRVALVCGTLIAPLMHTVAERLNGVDGLDVHVVAVENRFFGERVTVSGLLTGQDVLVALRSHEFDLVLLPRVMFDFEGVRTLDDYSVHTIEEELAVPVIRVDSPQDLVRCFNAEIWAT